MGGRAGSAAINRTLTVVKSEGLHIQIKACMKMIPILEILKHVQLALQHAIIKTFENKPTTDNKSNPYKFQE